jgi:amino acid transporter
MEKKSTFIRTASGLVRQYGAFDSFLMGTFVTWGLLWAVMQFPWFYGFFPYANLPLALLIVAPPFILYGIVYWILGVSMPRAGADYMWVTRTIGPGLGFAWSMMWFVAFFHNAFIYPLVAFVTLVGTSLAVPGILFNIGWLTDLSAFILSPNGTFAFGLLIVAIFALITIVGWRAMKPLFYAAWISEVIGIIVMWALLATANPDSFARLWDASSLGKALPYGQVLPTAVSNGFNTMQNSWDMTLACLPLASLFFFGYYYQTIVAGEVKDIRKSIPLSIFGVFAATYVWWAVSSTLNLRAFGAEWFYGLSYLWENTPSVWAQFGLPTPTMNLMLSVLAYPNGWLMGVIAVTFIVTSIPMVYVVFFLTTRYFFAWGFDRVIPTRLAEVHRTYRTPVNATAALAILSVIWLLLYLYTGFSVFYTMSTFQMIVTFMGPSIAAMLIPYVRRNLFETLPPIVRYKIGGVPAISIVGAICTISFAYLSYLYYVTPQITTAGIYGTALMVGAFVLGIAIYLGSRAYWRSKGIAVDLAFKELPPD